MVATSWSDERHLSMEVRESGLMKLAVGSQALDRDHFPVESVEPGRGTLSIDSVMRSQMIG